MPDIEDFLDSVQQDIVDRLMGDPWFGQARMKNDGTYIQIPVIAEEYGDLDTSILKAISQVGPGLCIVAQALEWDVQYKNVPGPYYEDAPIVLLGIENVPLNRGTRAAPSPSGSLKKIKSTMIRAQELLHLWTPPTLSRAIVCGRAQLQRVGNKEDGDAGIVQYSVMAKAAGGVGILAAQVAKPTAVVALDGSVTLACATPGAAICYSLDGSNPSPRTGTIYNAVAFTPLAGQLMRVNAWLTYFSTSETLTQQF